MPPLTYFRFRHDDPGLRPIGRQGCSLGAGERGAAIDHPRQGFFATADVVENTEAQLADNLRENSPTYKNHVKSALESAIYDNAADEQTADALTDAVNVYFDSIVDDVQEALEEFAAPLPPAKSKRIDANFGYCR